MRPVPRLNDRNIQRVFDEIQAAELAHFTTGISHAEFLRQRRNRYQGQVRRELDKIAALGADAEVFVRTFLDELKEYAA